MVPVCIDDERKIDQGIQPDIRTVQDSSGARVAYVNAGFAPAYWGGFGYGGAMLGGFLLGEALASPPSSSTGTATATRDTTSGGLRRRGLRRGYWRGNDGGGGDFLMLDRAVAVAMVGPECG